MSPDQQLPLWQCHKKVHAIGIGMISAKPDGGATIIPGDAHFGPIEVDQAYLDKHKPAVGGYYVIYDDGYTSWSPREAFEAGYTRL